ncbi:MAG TPA: UDP-N-acetylmuramate--L-alanine ligase, partial [Clostridiales bacterium]|nr:UDP-N-acetylmuramate--L-alanine ligase [Clostridiales bacterium]
MGKKIFFIGIGGVNMSALALMSKDLGYLVSGSDKTYNEYIFKLEQNGIDVFIGHDKNNVKKVDVVVYSDAINKENEELKQALKMNISTYSRGEFLDFISNFFTFKIGISGTHGKTTTTSLISNVIVESDINCSCFIGGEDLRLSNYYYGGKDVLISEICEYKRNVELFKSDIAVCLNIDADHLECYNGLEDLRNSFYKFLDKAKFKVVNVDDERLKKYSSKNTIGISLKNQSAEYYAKILKIDDNYTDFSVFKNGKHAFDSQIKGFCLHNIYNALSCVAICEILKLKKETINKTFLNYKGVKRRMEFIGKKEGKSYYADYAHHPTEIESTLKSFKKVLSKDFLVVFQPHTFS